MKIAKVTLKRFKRFSDLTVRDLPQTARLIILAGPNGCGKSSFFDALNIWHSLTWRGRAQGEWQSDYYAKQIEGQALAWSDSVRVEFYDGQPSDATERKKAIYVRSAYRNDPAFQVDQMQRMMSALDEDRVRRTIDNDAAVAQNYKRLAAQGLEDLYERCPLTRCRAAPANSPAPAASAVPGTSVWFARPSGTASTM